MNSFLFEYLTLAITIGILIDNGLAKSSFDYCMPSDNYCWPSKDQWDELKAKITDGKLHDISDGSKYDKVCESGPVIVNGQAAYTLANEGEGRCMQYHYSAKKTCNEDSDWNIPEYSVEATDEDDIIEAIEFANKYNIQVVIKTSGHNYAGSSMGDGSLLIWMRNYRKYGDISTDFTKCDVMYDAVIKVGGGRNWNEIYTVVGSEYHIVGGGALTVSAAGGWLNGGGLSTSTRKYGMGIDQVIEFKVISAAGEKLTASACENEDLFWALRGGGGGTFGVTTSVIYKLHPVKPICEFSFETNDFTEASNWDVTTVYKWIELLVDSAPTLEREWGGDWTLNSGLLYFEGTEEQTKATQFYKAVNAMNGMDKNLTCVDSYFSIRYRGEPDITDDTGYAQFNIASRMIPLDFVENKPDDMKEILKWMITNGFYIISYMLGGKMNDVSPTDTSTHPVMRQSIFQIETYDNRLVEMLREKLPDSAVGVNHAAKDEPDWENQFWGSNLAKLKTLKAKYDPDNRFNCWHCVGYLSPATEQNCRA